MFKTWKKFATRPAPVEVIDAVPVLDRSLAYRRFLRSVFQAPARLTLAGHMREVQVLDVSLKGALVDLGAVLPCPVGVRGRLRLLLSPTTFIAMDVAVSRAQGSRLGLQCLHIDLDSMTHLRQLMEHNAQDPALLGR
ncbi:MAG: PilZ domain-containing protein, partial [Curvibacter sp.]